jgi:DNA-binding response OmpR family regulator
MVVEDDPHIRELVSMHIGLEGLETVSVADGRGRSPPRARSRSISSCST